MAMVKYFQSWLVIAAAVVLLLAPMSRALTPDNVVLIINRNVPDSGRLAGVYAAARSIPGDHLIALDLPDNEEVSFDQFERSAVLPVRQFLRDHHLDRSTTCLCTFYGVPFRIRARENQPGDDQELTDLRAQLADAIRQATPAVEQSEALARALSPDFTRAADEKARSDIENLVARANHSSQVASVATRAITDPAQRQRAVTQIAELTQKLGGTAELFARFGAGQIADPGNSPDRRQKWLDLRDQITLARTQVRELEDQRFDRASRQKTREVTGQFSGR